MSRAWMPIYWGDYLRDTQHLTTLQHGAYLLLIGHYWQHGGLPPDERGLARVSGLSIREWRNNCQALAKLFLDGWRHKRIDTELEKQRLVSEKRAMSGRRGGLKSNGHTNLGRSISSALPKQTGQLPHKSNITSSETVTAPQGGRQGSHASPQLVASIREKGWAAPAQDDDPMEIPGFLRR